MSKTMCLTGILCSTISLNFVYSPGSHFVVPAGPCFRQPRLAQFRHRWLCSVSGQESFYAVGLCCMKLCGSNFASLFSGIFKSILLDIFGQFTGCLAATFPVALSEHQLATLPYDKWNDERPL